MYIMQVILSNGEEILEGIIGGIVLCFIEYILADGNMSLKRARNIGLAFTGAWICRKFAGHIYTTIMRPRGLVIPTIYV